MIRKYYLLRIQLLIHLTIFWIKVWIFVSIVGKEKKSDLNDGIRTHADDPMVSRVERANTWAKYHNLIWMVCTSYLNSGPRTWNYIGTVSLRRLAFENAQKQVSDTSSQRNVQENIFRTNIFIMISWWLQSHMSYDK